MLKTNYYYYPEIVPKQALWKICNMETEQNIIKTRTWKWIGPILRKHKTDLTTIILGCSIIGKRKRGRPLNSW